MNVEVVSPFPFESLPRVWQWAETFRQKVTDDFSPQTIGAFMAAMSDKWDLPTFQTWSISVDGELGGMISFERVTPWLGTAHILLKPGFQGRGVSITALRTAFGEMFALGVGKLAFFPLAGSLAVGSLLINLGARREGKLIAHTLIGGKPADINLYGLTREEFENANAGNPGSDVDLVRDRGRGVGSGLGAIQPEKDLDLDQHTNALAADASPNG